MQGTHGSLLGPLAGAQAQVVGGRGGHRRDGGARTADAIALGALGTAIAGPVGMLAGAALGGGVSRQATTGTAFVALANGTLHEFRLTDAAALVRAQSDVVRFNAMAATAGPPGGDEFTDADHERALRAGRYAMAAAAKEQPTLTDADGDSPFAPCPACGTDIQLATKRWWERDGKLHRCGEQREVEG